MQDTGESGLEMQSPRQQRARTGTPARVARARRGGFTIIELVAVLALIGILASMAVAQYTSAIRQAKIARAIGDLSAISQELNAAVASDSGLPPSLDAIGRGTQLDPWGRPYQYLNFALASPGNGVPGAARKDRFLVPINSEYDLYSLGEDGQSAPPLSARASQDDIVVAADGGFIGLGSKF